MSYLDLEERLAEAVTERRSLEVRERDTMTKLIAAEADRERLVSAIQKWREGRAYLGVPMTYVDQRLVDETRTFIGDKRAAGVKHG